LVWGKDVEFLQKRAAAGKPTPALENRPYVYEDLIDVWDVFCQLQRCRQCAFGISPLGFRDIIAAIEFHELPDKLDAMELIVAMDQEWLKWADEQNSTGK